MSQVSPGFLGFHLEVTLYVRHATGHRRLEVIYHKGWFQRRQFAYEWWQIFVMRFVERGFPVESQVDFTDNSHFVLLNGWGHPAHVPVVSLSEAPIFSPPWIKDFDQFMDAYLYHHPTALLFDARAHDFVTCNLADAHSQVLLEGAPVEVTLSRHERNRIARETCLRHYGRRCYACGADMSHLYGVVGVRCIQVHHLESLAEIGRQHFVDPVRDLRPVCPNCHAVIHQTIPPMDIEDLKARLSQSVTLS